jgi:S1-C subfamily serine protease
VPSNLAKHIMDELIAYGSVRRGTILGIELYPMDVRIAAELRAPNAKGVYVSGISPNSDAYAAGIREGDIIITFNGTSIEDAQHFMRLLAEAPIGGSVTMGLFRSGKTISAKVPIVQAQPGGRTRRR